MSTHSVDGRDGHARDAVPVRLLLQPARVGDDHARLRGERGELEVAERLDQRGRGRRARVPPPACARASAGDREDDQLVDPVQALDDAAEARLLDVRLAVDRRDDVRAAARVRHAGTPLARDRRERAARVGHHVADDVDPPEHALAFERPPRALVRAEEEPGEAVGLDPVVLLGHRRGRRCAARPRRARAGSTRPRPRARRRASSSCRRRRATRSGRSAAIALRDRRLHRVRVGGVEVEPVARLGEAELVEEDLRHSWSSAARCAARPRRSPPRAARPRAAPDLMNCGRFPTTVKTFIATKPTNAQRNGADRAEHLGQTKPSTGAARILPPEVEHLHAGRRRGRSAARSGRRGGRGRAIGSTYQPQRRLAGGTKSSHT